MPIQHPDRLHIVDPEKETWQFVVDPNEPLTGWHYILNLFAWGLSLILGLGLVTWLLLAVGRGM